MAPGKSNWKSPQKGQVPERSRVKKLRQRFEIPRFSDHGQHPRPTKKHVQQMRKHFEPGPEDHQSTPPHYDDQSQQPHHDEEEYVDIIKEIAENHKGDIESLQGEIQGLFEFLDDISSDKISISPGSSRRDSPGKGSCQSSHVRKGTYSGIAKRLQFSSSSAQGTSPQLGTIGSSSYGSDQTDPDSDGEVYDSVDQRWYMVEPKRNEESLEDEVFYEGVDPEAYWSDKDFARKKYDWFTRKGPKSPFLKPGRMGTPAAEPSGKGTYTTQAQGRGTYTAQPSGKGTYTAQPSGRGTYTAEASGRGTYTAEPSTGTYTTKPSRKGTYTSRPFGRGTYTAQPSGKGTFTAKPSGKGTFTAKPSGRGTYTSEATGRGTYTAQPSGKGTFTAKPSGRGTYTSEATGRGTYTAAPSGRGTNTTAPSGRGTYTAAPSGRGTYTAAPQGRGTYTTKEDTSMLGQHTPSISKASRHGYTSKKPTKYLNVPPGDDIRESERLRLRGPYEGVEMEEPLQNYMQYFQTFFPELLQKTKTPPKKTYQYGTPPVTPSRQQSSSMSTPKSVFTKRHYGIKNLFGAEPETPKYHSPNYSTIEWEQYQDSPQNRTFEKSPQTSQMNRTFGKSPQASQRNRTFEMNPQTMQMNRTFEKSPQTSEMNRTFEKSPQTSQMNRTFSPDHSPIHGGVYDETESFSDEDQDGMFPTHFQSSPKSFGNRTFEDSPQRENRQDFSPHRQDRTFEESPQRQYRQGSSFKQHDRTYQKSPQNQNKQGSPSQLDRTFEYSPQHQNRQGSSNRHDQTFQESPQNQYKQGSFSNQHDRTFQESPQDQYKQGHYAPGHDQAFIETPSLYRQGSLSPQHDRTFEDYPQWQNRQGSSSSRHDQTF